MRKYRPTFKCLYVIPEIHGAADSLKVIIDRIIPLRFHAGQEDMLVFLGDYIDKGDKSTEVLDILIELKKQYSDQIYFLNGNHEWMFLNALQSEDKYRNWLMRGGSTTVNNYILNAGLNSKPESFPWSRLGDIVPPAHIEFIQSLPSYLIHEDYVFFHGGFDFSKPPQENSDKSIAFDMSASHKTKEAIEKKLPLEQSDKVFVGSHNYKSKLPFICSKHLMLGGGAPKRLILFELNSMGCAMIREGKERIYKHNFKVYE